MILYINNEHCSSVEQLKGYFTENLTSDSDIYNDLLDYGRYGDIATWLREMGESEMASRVDSISGDLSDSAFFAQLKAAIVGMEIKTDEILKPSFDKCFSFEGMKCDVKDNEAKVSISLKVLMCVNEEYELCVCSDWGTRAEIVNPYHYAEGKTATIEFTLRKRPRKEIGEITLKAEGKELSFKTTQMEDNNEVISVGDVKFNMIRVEGGTFTMGSKGKKAHQVTLSTYYIGETQVTQRLWKEVMGNNPSRFCEARHHATEEDFPWDGCLNLIKRLNQIMDENLPVESISWNDCQEFIKKLNQRTGLIFRLPTEAEWEYAAKGGNKSKGYFFSGDDHLSYVAAMYTSPLCKGQPSPVKKQRPNELGIYNMSGNVWEFCQDWYGPYGSGAVSNPTGPTSGSERIQRGGAYYSEYGCNNEDRGRIAPNKRDSACGFRLALSPSKYKQEERLKHKDEGR